MHALSQGNLFADLEATSKTSEPLSKTNMTSSQKILNEFDWLLCLFKKPLLREKIIIIKQWESELTQVLSISNVVFYSEAFTFDI